VKISRPHQRDALGECIIPRARWCGGLFANHSWIRRDNSADTLASGLTPKAIIWIVMQITKIPFLTSAALVSRFAKLQSTLTKRLVAQHKKLHAIYSMGSIQTLARFHKDRVSNTFLPYL
jgi:hypothetical protein